CVRIPRPGQAGGPPPVDVGDQAEQVRAEYRRLAEAMPGPVAGRVIAASADTDNRAGLTLVAECGKADLPGGDSRLRQGRVKVMVEHVQTGVGPPLERRFQGVDLLHRPVRVDDDQAYRAEADRFQP